MNSPAKACYLNDRQLAVTLVGIPDLCPICHYNMEPKLVTTAILEERTIVQAIFRCTRQQCQEMFIGTYMDLNLRVGPATCNLNNVAPMSVKEEDFPEIIGKISPTFVIIYNQVLAAESSQLDQLVGIGLRKALEFLIKDYAKHEKSEEAEKIEKATLSQCIKNYISDENIKACAKRAVWLGNDETHYIKKWEDRDIQDLKRLVQLTVNWIDSEQTTKQYIEEMADSGPK